MRRASTMLALVPVFSVLVPLLARREGALLGLSFQFWAGVLLGAALTVLVFGMVSRRSVP